MRKMAEAFQTDIEALEEELSNLIIEGTINARIDSYNTVCCLNLPHLIAPICKTNRRTSPYIRKSTPNGKRIPKKHKRYPNPHQHSEKRHDG